MLSLLINIHSGHEGMCRGKRLDIYGRLIYIISKGQQLPCKNVSLVITKRLISDYMSFFLSTCKYKPVISHFGSFVSCY